MSSFHTLYFKDLSMLSFHVPGFRAVCCTRKRTALFWFPHPLLFLDSLLLQAASSFPPLYIFLRITCIFLKCKRPLVFFENQQNHTNYFVFKKFLYFLTSFYFCVKIQILRHIHHLNSINYTL